MNALILGVALLFQPNGDIAGWRLIAAFPTVELCEVSMVKVPQSIEADGKTLLVAPLCIPTIAVQNIKPHTESKTHD